jgi:hypothetical protein
MSSVIASDSSFEHNLEALDENREFVKRRTVAEQRFLEMKQANREDKPQSVAATSEKSHRKEVEKIEIVNPDPDQSDIPLDLLDDPTLKKGKKKKKKKKSKKKSAGAGGPEAKHNLFKQFIEGIDKVFVGNKRPINPFTYINKKTHKIEILGGLPYMSSSHSDVFEIRNNLHQTMCLQDNNRFIKANLGDSDAVRRQDDMEELLQDRKPFQFKAYQLKTCY